MAHKGAGGKGGGATVVVAHDGAGDLSMWVGMRGLGACGQERRWGEGWAWVVGGMCVAVIMVVSDGPRHL